MRARVAITAAALACLASWLPGTAQEWSFPGISNEAFNKMPPGGPAPVRQLTGLWDAGAAGIGGQGQAAARDAARAPFTPLGQQMFARNKPGNGANAASVAENNDPLNTLGDPSGFPRIVNYELRTIQIVETPGQVLMLFSFNKTWRSIWTDGRQLPREPDPRWFGYSIGRWEDDYTFVIETNGLDDRTWLDNNGHPHSTALKVTERYRRVNLNTLELTVIVDDPLVYTKPWLTRDKLPLKRLPDNTDVIEQIYAASEAQAYQDTIASQTKP